MIIYLVFVGIILILSGVVLGFIYKSYNKVKVENEKLKVKLEEMTKFFEETREKLQYYISQDTIMSKEIKNLQKKLDECKDIEEELEKVKNSNNILLQENSVLKEKVTFLENFQEKYENLLKENQKDKELIKELETKLKQKEDFFNEKFEIIKKSEEELKEIFENVANKILEKNTKKIAIESEKILAPLNQSLKDFKEKIEKFYESEIQNISFLSNELRNLKELNTRLSEEANNLTKALKGDIKKAGNWGEIVLERILEMSGLREGNEFEREVVFRVDNKIYRPDVVVYLPNDRIVIIDSKVSLKAYSDYIAGDEEAIKDHIKSIKNHIDNLAKKDYELLTNNSLDFIFMFVPIEGALSLALEKDPELFEYAFKKRIILTSPTTLLAALRSIEISWRYEKQAKNIAEVINIAENLYDKFVKFIDDFEKVGISLDNAKKSFENAKNRLKDGKGNIILTITKLKEKSGIKPKKELPKDLVEISKADE